MIRINGKEFKYSFSQNRVYEDCPKKYFFKYYLGLQEPSNENLELGNAVHKLLELQAWINKERSAEEESEIVMAKHLISKFKGTLYLYQLLEEIKEFYSDKDIIAIEKVVNTAECVCKIDCIYKFKNDPNKLYLIDYKVTKKPKSTNEMYSEGQLLLYKYAIIESGVLDELDLEDRIDDSDILVQYVNILPYNSFKIIQPSDVINLQQIDCVAHYGSMLKNMEKINSEVFPKKKKWCNWCFFKDMCNDYN